jgi:hypothetical protein
VKYASSIGHSLEAKQKGSIFGIWGIVFRCGAKYRMFDPFELRFARPGDAVFERVIAFVREYDSDQ